MLVRVRTGILLIFLACAAFVPHFALADVIDDFAATLIIGTDRSVQVTELIRYDFGETERHGIYRDIPATYIDEDGVKQPVVIDTLTVHDGTMAPVMFESFKNGDDLRLKIGHPDVLVTGKRTYEISYVAHDVIGFFEDHDELYWNITGNEWLLPIQHVSARVYAPASTTVHACFVGPRGSTIPCETQQVIAGDGSAWFFEARYPLAMKEGMTMALGWPKGIVTPPSESERIVKSVLKYFPLLLPVIAFVLLFRRWSVHGRDEKGRGTIIPEYDAPHGVTPALAYEIVHERMSSSVIAATIIELAVKRYLKIHRTEDTTLGIFTSVSYTFEKMKAADTGLSSEALVVFNGLFRNRDSVTDEDLKKDSEMITAFTAISSVVGAKAVAEGYFRANPVTVRVFYIGAAVLTLLAGIMLAASLESVLMFVAFVITAILVGVFGYFMPAKTKKGALVKEHILGLKGYLQIAEKNRLDFHHAPEKSPQLFEKLLPYAMVLGVSEAWAKEFEGLYTSPPDWYSGASYAAFTPAVFAADMNSLSTTVSTLATPTSSGGGTSGGGSSGGGFGGGGGGSW